MIGRIQGCLIEKQAPVILVSVQGLCYEINVPMTTFFDLPQIGESVDLRTHFVVREDVQQLYGFIYKNDRDLFRVLIKVSGIGPKVGLAILSGMTASEVVRCIQNSDKSALVRLPGIGPKTAERLIVETRDKVKDFAIDSAATISSNESVGTDSEPMAEAESALEALGYKKVEAARAIARVSIGEGAQTVEDLIRAALKQLG